MSGICGWVNTSLPSDQAESTLDAMIQRLILNPAHSGSRELGQEYAFATVGSAGQRLVAEGDDGRRLLLYGRPIWTGDDGKRVSDPRAICESALVYYAEKGHRFLERLTGTFSLALLDPANHRTLLAIDRIGIQSLFFAIRQDALVFSSDGRSIQAHPLCRSGIDPQAIYDYFHFHMVPSPRSIFLDQEKMLPGQYLQFEAGKASRGFYWQPDFVEVNPAAPEAFEESFRTVLRDAVGRTLQGGDIGAFLSGGTDSSTVVGYFRELAGKSVDTYSIGFEAEGFDESEYARIAARHFIATPHEYYLSPQEVVEAIPLIAGAYDEPFGNASAVAAYYCARLARSDGHDVLLAGDGGDELFAGNERYAKQKIFELYYLVPGWLRSGLLEPLLFGFPYADRIRPLAKAQSYVQQARVPLPDRLETYNFLNRFPLSEIFEPSFLAGIDPESPVRGLRETYSRANAKTSLNRMLYLDWKFTLADNDLRKVNRTCELAQVEVRYPLLDDELMEFSTRIPTDMKLKGFQLRHFFKHSLRDFLPPEILKKSKHGFGLPFGPWMNSHPPLRDIAVDSLDGLARRGYVRREFIDKLMTLHQEHAGYYGVMIWVMMMLEQWLRQVESAPANTRDEQAG